MPDSKQTSARCRQNFWNAPGARSRRTSLRIKTPRHLKGDQSPHRSCRPGLFDDLDRQLGSDRGPNGEPSSTDFIVIDLPTLVDEFAENFDTLPIAYPDRPDYGLLVVGGTLIAASVVVGQLVADDSIVLLDIELDLAWPDERVD